MGRRGEERGGSYKLQLPPPPPPTPLSNLQLKSSATNFNLIVRRSRRPFYTLFLRFRPSTRLASPPLSSLFARKRRSQPSLEICPVQFPKLFPPPLAFVLFLARSLARSTFARLFLFCLSPILVLPLNGSCSRVDAYNYVGEIRRN